MMQQRCILLLLCFCSQTIAAQKLYQLATPLASFESVFFDKQTTLSFKFEQPGSTIHYTTDGSEPDATSALYEKPITVNKHLTVVKAIAVADGFAASETVALPFFAIGLSIAAINTSAPNKQYAGNGAPTLTDYKSGGTNHQSAAWLGFDSDSIVVDISLDKSKKISQVLLHVLSNQGAWIFAPQAITVYAMEKDQRTLIKSQLFETSKEAGTDTKAILIDLPQTDTKQLRIVVYPLASLPEWHAGKGNKAWFFIDEIKIY